VRWMQQIAPKFLSTNGYSKFLTVTCPEFLMKKIKTKPNSHGADLKISRDLP
jgi:hypothetical protein